MEQRIGVPTSWKGVSNASEAKQMIDYGIILTWKEMKSLRRQFTEEDQDDVVAHFAIRLGERYEERLAAEVLTESLLVWFSVSLDEKRIDRFIDQLFEDRDVVQIVRAFTEISLATELTDTDHYEEMFATAVSLICELGLALQATMIRYPEEFKDGQEAVDHITTYLLSVANNNHHRIRLCLLHYFANSSVTPAGMISFNRVLSRFGHTVLDYLFSLLFNKKTEAVALKYLVENLPFVLAADNKAQRILYDIFKYYMLKIPERFTLFLQIFADHLIKNNLREVQTIFLQHLGTLFHVVSDVNHKILAKELILCISKFEEHEFCEILYDRIMQQPTIRPTFKEVVGKVRTADNKQEIIESFAQFRSSKRGRRPSFAKCGEMGALEQITELGNAFLAGKAS